MAVLCDRCGRPLAGQHECGGGDSTEPAPEAVGPVESGVSLPEYRPAIYWDTLHARGGLSAVANPWVPEELNRWFYRNWSRNLRSFVRRQNLHPASVFDVGAGTGYWVSWWLRYGARDVRGCDLSPIAIGRLRRRFGDGFEHLDVAERPVPGQFDLVSVMNVLLHVMDEDGFRRALGHVAQGVAPGGHLLLMEPLLGDGAADSQEVVAGASSRARPSDAYVAPVLAAGLQLVTIEPSTVIGSDPIDAGSKAFAAARRSWYLINRVPQRIPAAAPVVGVALYAADPVLLRLGLGPSEKFALFRRPAH